MRTAIMRAGWMVLSYSVAFGQAPEAPLTFEVASVKPAGPPSARILRMRGGPGTSDPGRFSSPGLSLKLLLLRAYGLMDYQISGPNWLDSTRVDILAKVPPGATKEQLNGMLQNLLVERFNLTFHHEAKVMAVYELTAGENRPKLEEADLNVPPPPVREPGTRPPSMGNDKAGFLQLPPGPPIIAGKWTDGIMRLTFKAQSLSAFATFLGRELERPVADKTGLTGQYDFRLAYGRRQGRPSGQAAAPDSSPADPSGRPSLLAAVQEQLGLKLESKKDPIDILVIDHIDKVPTDN
jgi:uncharacterized protein (TIGR03435 family)